MNLQESHHLVALLRKTGDRAGALIALMSIAQTADELAVPLYAYQLIYPDMELPPTPMFVCAQTIIDNALYFARGREPDRVVAINGITGAPNAGYQSEFTDAVGGPESKLISDYAMAPPSDKARREVSLKRQKDGYTPGGRSIVKSTETVKRFDQQYPRHWTA